MAAAVDAFNITNEIRKLIRDFKKVMEEEEK